MSMEAALAEFEFRLLDLPHQRPVVIAPSRFGWAMSQIVLGGLLLTYLAGWAQDIQRVQHLRAEPVPFSKVVIITKHEAYDRIHPTRTARRSGKPVRPYLGPAETIREGRLTGSPTPR